MSRPHWDTCVRPDGRWAGCVVSEKAAQQYRSLALCWLGGPPTQDGVQVHV